MKHLIIVGAGLLSLAGPSSFVQLFGVKPQGPRQPTTDDPAGQPCRHRE